MAMAKEIGKGDTVVLDLKIGRVRARCTAATDLELTFALEGQEAPFGCFRGEVRARRVP
jgi:hypothetical protein